MTVLKIIGSEPLTPEEQAISDALAAMFDRPLSPETEAELKAIDDNMRAAWSVRHTLRFGGPRL